MQNSIHKKSLKITLLENSGKIKTLTKNLISVSILICVGLLLLSFKQERKTVLIIAIPISMYTLYASYQILNLWKTHKKIKEKLETL